MSKHMKYVVVDWGSWGIDVQSSSKIVVPDPFNVSEGDDCSIQATDPKTKRPMMFQGNVLAVFGTKKEAEKKVTELVSLPETQEQETTLNGCRPRRQPKPSKKKLAELDTEENVENEEGKTKKKRKVSNDNENSVVSQKQKQKRKTKKAEDENNEKEIVAAANAKRVQNLLLQRQHVPVCTSDEDAEGTEIIEVEKERDVRGSEKTSEQEDILAIPQQPSGVTNNSPPLRQPSGVTVNSPPLQQPSGVTINSPPLQQPSGVTNNSPPLRQPSGVTSNSPPLRQPSGVTINLPPLRQPSGVTNNSPPLRQPSGVTRNSPPLQQPSGVTSNSPLHQSSDGTFSSTPLRQTSGHAHSSLHRALAFSNGSPLSNQSLGVSFNSPSPHQATNKGYSSPYQASDGTSSLSYQPFHATSNSSPQPTMFTSSLDQGTPQGEKFSFMQSLHHCSDFNVSDLDLTVNPNYLLETSNHISRDDNRQKEPPFSNPPACSSCQPMLMSLNNRLSSLEAEFEKMKRKQRKGKVVVDNEVLEREDPNEERFNGFTKESLIKSLEDHSDAKSAVETLAKQLFTAEELQGSSVTGFQCNKAYESRPALSPRRRNLIECIVKKNFQGSTRSSIRKDLGLMLKKARANKENKKQNKP